MEANKKAARIGTGTASNTANDSHYSTKTDPLTGWYSLGVGVKLSRTERTPKRGWKRKSRGGIDPLLALYLGLLALGALIFLGVA